MNKTVTSEIGNTYKDWTVGENIILDMAMGRGKTFFIVNVLGEYAKRHGKKILYLCNRSKLAEEVFGDVKKTWAKNVTVKTYQALQKSIEKHEEIDVYDYIVCDECHYLFKDAWNDKTDIMYMWLKDNKFTCKIFMSATGHNVFPCIRRWGDCKEYKLDADYSYIKKIVFYDNDCYIDRVIEQLEEDEKVVYFSRKIDNAYQVYEKYKEMASFNCSTHTKHKEYKQYITKDAIYTPKDDSKKRLLKNKVTCTTSAWDNGINIKDSQLKHIICDMEDLVTLIQAIGRKRVGKIVEDNFVLSDDDNITLHIRKWSKQNVTQFLNPKVATYSEAKKYVYEDKEWIEEQNVKRSKHINPCFYIDFDAKKVHMNHSRYIGLEKEINRLKYAKKHGFDKYVLNGLGKSFTGEVEYVSIEQECKKDSLELFMEYLNSKVATRLFKDDQVELKDEFAKAGLSVKSDRNMGMKTMNGFMEENNVPFRIESSRITVDGKKHTIWTILQ